jgi:competence protein ComGC
MKSDRYLIVFLSVAVLGVLFVGCRPKMDMMSKAEKAFVKMVDKTAGELNLSEDQKIQLERLKLDIRKNFQEGQIEKKEALVNIKEEGIKETSDIRKMTSLLQGLFRAETERINRAFDLMVEFRKNLNEDQNKKLNQMISEWVAKWE